MIIIHKYINNKIWKYGEPKELSKPHSQGAGGIYRSCFADREKKQPVSVTPSNRKFKSRWVNCIWSVLLAFCVIFVSNHD